MDRGIESIWFVALTITAIVAACGGDDESPSEEEIPPSQGASERCDPGHGIDACGAGLFCAAFDGREVETCYPLGSRGPGDECGDNSHCSTDLCSGGNCAQASVGHPCESDNDCATFYCHDVSQTCAEP